MRGIAMCVALAAILFPAAAQNDILGVEWSGTSFAVNPASGAGMLLGPSGFTGRNSMARSGGRFYTADTAGNLIAINPGSGVGTIAAVTSPLLNDIRGMATIPDGSGLIYAIKNGGSTTTADVLHTIDPMTGNTTLIGTTTGFSGLQALAFEPNGTLYSWDVGSGTGTGAGLVTINPSTGATTDVNPAVNGTGAIQCLAFSETGTLYRANSSLYRINPLTGATALIGSGPYNDLRGIEFRHGPTGGN